MNRTTIIAEAGVNHNGKLSLAKRLVDQATEAKVDYIKFQTFKADELVSKNAEKADYQQRNTLEESSQYEMLKKLELTPEMHETLIAYCEAKGVKFLSTAFDLGSVDYLKDKLDFYKIPSGELTNLPYLEKVASLGLPVVMSTGMATLKEVDEALNVLYTGGLKKQDVTLLHCNTMYPTPMQDVNLNAMLTMKREFGVDVGYSDHTLGIEVPIAAVALGATVIEKHFTLSRDLEGPDHAASLEPEELKAMVQGIRNIEKAMGDGLKKPSNSEMPNIAVARKSIVAIKDIKKGEVFTENNIGVKRPGTGLSPMRWYEVLGKVANRDYLKEQEVQIE